MAILAACSEKDPGMGSIDGTIEVPSHGYSAAIEWTKAVAYAEDGRLLVFLTGAAGASCAGIADYLGPNTGALSKEGILEGGSCTMMLAVDDWTGDSTVTWSPSETEGYNPGLSSVLRCELGDGEWVLETRAEEYEDYYWSGDVWVGSPTLFSWSISGDSDGIEVSLDLEKLDGNFPYSSDLARYPAAGEISGEMSASWCPELASATAL
jgi:hypothetical protein